MGQGPEAARSPMATALLILVLFPQREEAAAVLPRPVHSISPMRSVLLTLVALAGVAGLLVALAVALCMRQHARQRDKERLTALGPEGAHGDTTFEYQVCSIPRSLLKV
jgi:heme/copper-type cytochrome/quinol oxidase subunit 2